MIGFDVVRLMMMMIQIIINGYKYYIYVEVIRSSLKTEVLGEDDHDDGKGHIFIY